MSPKLSEEVLRLVSRLVTYVELATNNLILQKKVMEMTINLAEGELNGKE